MNKSLNHTYVVASQLTMTCIKNFISIFPTRADKPPRCKKSSKLSEFSLLPSFWDFPLLVEKSRCKKLAFNSNTLTFGRFSRMWACHDSIFAIHPRSQACITVGAASHPPLEPAEPADIRLVITLKLQNINATNIRQYHHHVHLSPSRPNIWK